MSDSEHQACPHCGWTAAQQDAQAAEVERLRAVLERLTNGYKYSTEVVTIAREALREKEGE